MKIAMRLTLDGLIRALRTRAHDLADAREISHSDPVAAPNRAAPRRIERSRKGRATGGAHGRTGA